MERNVVLESDTVSLVDTIKAVITDSRYGYVRVHGDDKVYSDANVIHIALEDFYDNICRIARKSGINLR